MREITRKIDEQINSVRRELSNLLSIGIITSENTNNKLYYEVNQTFEYYEPLQQIFGGGVKKNIRKAAVVADEQPAEQDLRSIGHVELALYTGQFTRDDSSGVDFLVAGDVNPNALQKYVDELEQQEGKSLRYAAMSVPEFTYRQQINDRFATSIMNAKKQVLVDVHGLLSGKKPKKSSEKPDTKEPEEVKEEQKEQ